MSLTQNIYARVSSTAELGADSKLLPKRQQLTTVTEDIGAEPRYTNQFDHGLLPHWSYLVLGNTVEGNDNHGQKGGPTDNRGKDLNWRSLLHVPKAQGTDQAYHKCLQDGWEVKGK